MLGVNDMRKILTLKIDDVETIQHCGDDSDTRIVMKKIPHLGCNQHIYVDIECNIYIDTEHLTITD